MTKTMTNSNIYIFSLIIHSVVVSMKQITKIIGLLLMVLMLSTTAFAEDHEDEGLIEAYGEEVLNLGSGILATVLFVLTFMAYKRTNRSRLLYISLAFLLFAVKGYLSGAELFFGEWLWVDSTTGILDFAILLSFFRGIMKK